jgi:hypothetical protein
MEILELLKNIPLRRHMYILHGVGSALSKGPQEYREWMQEVRARIPTKDVLDEWNYEERNHE